MLFDLGDVLVRLRWDRMITRLVSRLKEMNPGLEIRSDASTVLEELKKSLTPAGEFYGASLEYMSAKLEANTWLPRLANAVADQIFKKDSTVPDVEELQIIWCDMFDAWPEMMALAEAVKRLNHPYYILSNTCALHWNFLASAETSPDPRLAQILSNAAGRWLSYEVGVSKPDERYWLNFLEHYGLTKEECLYVDDGEANVDTARKLGFRAFRHYRPNDLGTLRSWLHGNGVMVPGAELFG